MSLEHLLRFLQEDLGLVSRTDRRLLRLLCTQEHGRFRQEGTQNGGSEEQGRPGPKHGAPRVRGVGNDRDVDDGRHEITCGVTLLNDAASEAAELDWKVFESGGGREAPDATHRNTEKRTDDQELAERLNEAGRKRKYAA